MLEAAAMVILVITVIMVITVITLAALAIILEIVLQVTQAREMAQMVQALETQEALILAALDHREQARAQVRAMAGMEATHQTVSPGKSGAEVD
jgi:hypothetical protein